MFKTILGSAQVNSRQNTEINKQSHVKFWLNWMKYEHVSYSLGCSKIVYVSHLHKVYKIMHKDKPLKKNHCTWVIFTRIFTDTMKRNFATSFMVLPLIILPNELQEFRRKNLWKNYIKISKRSLGKKSFVLSFQSSDFQSNLEQP